MARNFGWLLVIAAILGGSAGGAFAAGRTYESTRGPATPGGARVLVTGGAASGAPGPGGQAAQANPAAAVVQSNPAAPVAAVAPSGPGAGRATIGTVTKVEGQVLTVTTAENQSVVVTVPSEVPVMRQAQVAMADVTVGMRVSVIAQGQAGQGGGPVTAQAVSVMPDGQGGNVRIGQGGQGSGGPGGPGGPGGNGGPGRSPGGPGAPAPAGQAATGQR